MYLCKSLQAFSETLEITCNLSEVCPEDLRNSPGHDLLPILRMAGLVLGNFYQIFFFWETFTGNHCPRLSHPSRIYAMASHFKAP